MRKNYYPGNLTEKQWSFIDKIIEPNKKRKRKHALRDIFNAILYVVKSGCQWRMLAIDFAPRKTVYFYYRKWKFEGGIEQIHEFLRSLARKQAGRNESPSQGIIDSRSLKTSRQNAQERGYDGGKKIKSQTPAVQKTKKLYSANSSPKLVKRRYSSRNGVIGGKLG